MRATSFKKTFEKWQVKVFCALTTFFVVFFYQNCGQYRATQAGKTLLLSSTPPTTVSCKVQSSLTTPFEKNKIQIDESLLENEVDIQSSSGQIQNKMVMPLEIKLGLVVDPLCLSQSESPVLVLGQVVEVPAELSQLNRAAISLTFNKGEIDLDQLTRDMDQSPCLIGISEDQTVTLENVHSSSTASGFNDPRVGEQAHLDFVNHSESIDLQNKITASVVVAVVDSGIDENHPDFEGLLWDDGQGNHGRNFTTSSTSNSDLTDLSDANSHGTHVAGLIAAKQNNNTGTVGLNGDFVRIMTAKVFGSDGRASVVTIYNGLRYAIENGADVVNLSLSTEKANTILDQGTMEAVNAGLVVAMAASNDSEEITFSNCPSPACFGRVANGAMTVASVDTSTGNLSVFSNYSLNFVEIAAPGSESGRQRGLLSTVAGSSWGRKLGTSMASPVVVAAAAFLIGYLKTKNINYTPASIEAFLKEKGSRENSAIRSSVQGGRVVDFGQISQSLKDLYENNNGNDHLGCP